MGLLSRGATSFLPDRDYLPLAMPTTAMDVLWVLTRQGGVLRRFGRLPDVLASEETLPEDLVSEDAVVASARGAGNRTVKAGLSVGIANALVAALGAKAEADLSATGARSVEFAYVDVSADDVNLIRLDGWLHGADLASPTTRIAELLVAEKLYLVVGVLRAKGLLVKMSNQTGAGVTLDIPALQEIVGASVSVTAAGERSSEVVFRGADPLVIAAKVAQLKAEPQGFWVNERLLTDGEIRDLSDGPSFLQADELVLD